MLTCQYAKFSLPQRSTYLNCAYMAPLLKSVEKVGIHGLRRKRDPGSITAQDFFADSEALRKEFARLVNAPDALRTVIIPSVSYGMATAAKNLKIKAGQHIIVAAEQFPSNYYPWQSLCEETGAQVKVISPEKASTDRGKNWNIKILESIDLDTKAVAIAHTHWADGTKFDLEAIRKRTTEVGALLIVDGTQSVGALPFDIQKIKPDALVCAGYKWLLGPYSIGMAYYNEYFDGGKPLEENWINRLNSEDFTALVNYKSGYQAGALRYEVGEHSNFILVPMLLSAMKQINRWGVDRIQHYCSSIAEPAIDTLRSHGCWIEHQHYRAAHLFGVRLPAQVNINALKTDLQKNKIFVSFRGDAIRVAPHVYNDAHDLNRLVKAITRNL